MTSKFIIVSVLATLKILIFTALITLTINYAIQSVDAPTDYISH